MVDWHYIWHYWHLNVCVRLRFTTDYFGNATLRKDGWQLTVAKLQMPLCRWLDGKAHRPPGIKRPASWYAESTRVHGRSQVGRSKVGR